MTSNLLMLASASEHLICSKVTKSNYIHESHTHITYIGELNTNFTL